MCLLAVKHGKKNGFDTTFFGIHPGTHKTCFFNRYPLKRHGSVSVWVYVSFSSVNHEEKGPYTHTLTSTGKLFFVVFGTLSSKTRCLSAKPDTLTSKKWGRFQQMLYFCLSQNCYFVVFYGQKHIHSYTNFDLSIGFSIFKSNFELPWVYECMCVFWP